MRFASLGSGSRGNALVVASGETVALLDCGFSVKETERRLGRLGLEAQQISGLWVTHEHSDHLAGVSRLARKYAIPVWLTPGTLAATSPDVWSGVEVNLCQAGESVACGDLQIFPYAVPHDAREPVQYVFTDGPRRLGILTDAGEPTPHILEMLAACDGLVLECNHDPELLARSSYPDSLKRRVAGRFGHLANGAAADLLGQLDVRRLQHVVAAHLSQENNRPELAMAALAGVLGCGAEEVEVASQAYGFVWRDLA